MYTDILKKIVNNYDYYKDIAVNLEWAESRSEYYDWTVKAYTIGMNVRIYDFPENYVRDNFEKAYTQAVLSDMAYYEEWEQDFWKIPQSERIEYMTNADNFYSDYITYKEYRMESVTEDFLIQIIKHYAAMYTAKNYNIPESEVNSAISYLTGAENIDIGGYYSLDHTFISIKDSSIMLIDYGVWD